jgi:catechol 2,3-dioxygenase-like lactoylglutathione lyase family enzyme
MRIHRLELETPELAAQRIFYGEVLGLPVLKAADDTLEVMAGTSRLVFRSAAPGRTASHHFAFNIPRNLFKPARDWLARRTPLIKDHQGRDVFFFEEWDADAIYFYDPAGNIVELIAQRTLDHEAEPPFGSKNIQCLSEIGVAVPDVRATAALLQGRTRMSPYRQQPAETFAPMGTAEGLIILVARGREWFPDTGVRADHLPITVILSTEAGVEHTLSSMPQGLAIS